MGIRYTRTGGGSTGGASYRNMAHELTTIIEEEMTVAGEAGKQEARDIVDRSGTGKQWSGPFRDRGGSVRTSASAGRVNTSEMRDALDFRIIRGKDVGLDVGWIKVWEIYFGAQDQGFDAAGYRHVNVPIEGMHVMAHLHVFMRGKVDEALDRATKRIVDGL